MLIYLLPFGGQCRFGITIGVQQHQRFGIAPARKFKRIIAERREPGTRRLQHGQPDAPFFAVTGFRFGRVKTAAKQQAAGEQAAGGANKAWVQHEKVLRMSGLIKGG
ncbi:hypothetical protein D3C73_1319810 [compost metagenome]